MARAEITDVTREDVQSLMGFIRDTVADAGSSGVVIGISGGIDSAVATKLCVDALGPGKVLNIFMPSTGTSEDDYRSTESMCADWGTEYRVIDIQPAIDTLVSMLPVDESPLEIGNISARCRMAVLYNFAKKRNSLVIGTCNRSELMMGYFTKFGDGACDVTPLADMYKTEVRQVAAIIGVPQEIIDKPPSAGLWEGQTDESEMGIRYCDLDAILIGMENGLDDKRISEDTGKDPGKVAEIRRQVGSMEHKRLLPRSPGRFR